MLAGEWCKELSFCPFASCVRMLDAGENEPSTRWARRKVLVVSPCEGLVASCILTDYADILSILKLKKKEGKSTLQEFPALIYHSHRG